MSYKDVMKLPYISFVLGMADAPQIDYSSKEEEKENKPKSANEEASAIMGALG